MNSMILRIIFFFYDDPCTNRLVRNSIVFRDGLVCLRTTFSVLRLVSLLSQCLIIFSKSFFFVLAKGCIALAILYASLNTLRHLYCILCSLRGFSFRLPPKVSQHHFTVSLSVIAISIAIRQHRYLLFIFLLGFQYCATLTVPSPSNKPAK